MIYLSIYPSIYISIYLSVDHLDPSQSCECVVQDPCILMLIVQIQPRKHVLLIDQVYTYLVGYLASTRQHELHVINIIPGSR